MTLDEATNYAETIRESMAPYCRRIAVAGSIAVPDKEEVFRVLGLRYVTPEERPGAGQVIREW